MCADVSAPGAWLASGREADVFALDGDRVLRRYRHGGDVTAEAAVMAYLRDRGYPVPVVHTAAGPDLVMERLDGPTMAEALVAGTIPTGVAAATLADLHRLLHVLPGQFSPDPAVRVLHLDLHPANVILHRRGPVVIDWRNATEGPPDLDVALTAMILGEAGIGLYGDVRELAGECLAGFLRHAGGDPLSQLPRALAMRTANPSLTPTEHAALPRAAALVRECADGVSR